MMLASDGLAALMLAPEAGPSRITVSAVIHACAEHYGIAPGLLTEPDGGTGQRLRWIVRKRQLAMYLARELTVNSTVQIGDMFGGRDHTVVLNATKRVQDLVRRNNDYTNADIRAVLRRLGVVKLAATP